MKETKMVSTYHTENLSNFPSSTHLSANFRREFDVEVINVLKAELQVWYSCLAGTFDQKNAHGQQQIAKRNNT